MQHQAPRPRSTRRGGLIGLLIAWLAWWHRVFVRWAKSCLDAAEETLNSMLRESLSITQRAINGASAWTLSSALLCLRGGAFNDCSCCITAAYLDTAAGSTVSLSFAAAALHATASVQQGLQNPAQGSVAGSAGAVQLVGPG